MEGKRRLPSWMIQNSDHSSKKPPVHSEALKKRHDGAKRGRKQAERRIMYWMNEQELVETAMRVLTKSRAGDRCAAPPPETTVIPETDEEQMTDSEVLDVAQQETVPYAVCSERNTENPSAQTEVQEKTAACESEDDALQVLRDIFFK